MSRTPVRRALGAGLVLFLSIVGLGIFIACASQKGQEPARISTAIDNSDQALADNGTGTGGEGKGALANNAADAFNSP